MNEREFCYWLQGMFELTDADELSKEQVKMIKDHLGLVFTKVTPSLEKPKLDSPLLERLDTQVYC